MTLLSQLLYKQSHRFNFQNAKYTFRPKSFLTTSYKTFNLQISICLYRNNGALVFVFSLEFPHSLDYCEKHKFNTHQWLSTGERGKQQFCIPGDIYQHFKIFWVRGVLLEYKTGRLWISILKLKGLFPSQMPTVLKLGSLGREEQLISCLFLFS